MSRFLYGIDIGGTKIEIVVFDQNLVRLHSRRARTPVTSYSDLLETIYAMITAADQKCNAQGVIGIGFPGVFGNDDLAIASNIKSATGQRFTQDLAELCGRKISIANDAKSFAISEANGGAGAGFDRVLGVILGTGANSGLCIGGKQFDAIAGEWGHAQIGMSVFAAHGLTLVDCGCGSQGCYETYVSGPGLARIHRERSDEELSARQVWSAYRAGDPLAISSIRIYVDILCHGLRMLVIHYNPDVIILGGGMSGAGELYRLASESLRAITPKGFSTPDIRPPKFGDASGARGAALQAMQEQLAA